MIDGTTDKAQLSQEAGLHRIFNMKTYVPEEIVLGHNQKMLRVFFNLSKQCIWVMELTLMSSEIL